MILAGLDTGTTSGLGLIRGDRLIHAESRHFDGEDPEAFFRYSRWLDEVFQRFDIAELAFESPLRTNSTVKTEEIVDDELIKTERPIGNMRTFLRLYGIRGCTLLALQRHKVRRAEAGSDFDFREVNVRTWRSRVFGKISPPDTAINRSAWWKEQALGRCKILQWPVTQKDAAEGAMIAEWLRIAVKEERLGIKERSGEPDLFEPRQTETRKETPF